MIWASWHIRIAALVQISPIGVSSQSAQCKYYQLEKSEQWTLILCMTWHRVKAILVWRQHKSVKRDGIASDHCTASQWDASFKKISSIASIICYA